MGSLTTRCVLRSAQALGVTPFPQVAPGRAQHYTAAPAARSGVCSNSSAAFAFCQWVFWKHNITGLVNCTEFVMEINHWPQGRQGLVGWSKFILSDTTHVVKVTPQLLNSNWFCLPDNFRRPSQSFRYQDSTCSKPSLLHSWKRSQIIPTLLFIIQNLYFWEFSRGGT